LNDKSPAEYLDWKRNYWLDFLNKIDFSEKDIQLPIIDIGCGPAGIFMILNNKSCTAIDPLLQKYEADLSIFTKEKYPNVAFETTDFESFKTTNKYKTVFCINAINHFIDIQLSFNKLYNLTENKGTLVLSIDTHNFSFFKHLFRLIPFDILHPHQHNLSEYIVMLELAGYKLKQEHCLQKHFFFNYRVLVAEKI
jgi:2-polyprenyl-6-hydroxyphenyl methylase/3-demethylubiquinone-9 3-methyltransferase